MTVRTKGDMCGLTVRTESSYGAIGSGTSEYAGTLQTLSTSDTQETSARFVCGSRASGQEDVTSVGFGFSATMNLVRGYLRKWIERTVGGHEGIQRDIPSFTSHFRASATEGHLYTGCRVNRLSVSASKIGGLVEVSADIVGRWHTITPFKNDDGNTLSFTAESVPSGAPLTYLGGWTYNGTALPTVKAFKLSISNNLTSDPGLGGSELGGYFGLDAGSGSAPQDCDIDLELTITSVDATWDAIRLARTTGATFTVMLDDGIITLSGCTIDPNGPSRSQGSYDEVIKVKASNITMSLPPQ